MRDDLAMLLSSPAAAFLFSAMLSSSGMHPPAKLLGPIMHVLKLFGPKFSLPSRHTELAQSLLKTKARYAELTHKNPTASGAAA